MQRTESKPPPFFCPKCGQKHRADVTSLHEKPGTVLKATCKGCGLPLAVSLGPTGEIKCVADPEAPAKPAAPTASAPRPAPVPELVRRKDRMDTPAPPANATPPTSTKPPAPPAPTPVAAAATEAPTPAPAGVPTAPAPSPSPAAAAPSPAKAEAPKPAKTEREKPPAPTPSKDAHGKDAPVSGRQAAREKDREKEKEAEAGRRIENAEFAPGSSIGRYRVEEAIGRGGTGTVYRVFDATTNRTVALKVLLADLSDAMKQRFLREIEVQANIRHPNIMPVFDRGELADGRPYFTMELLYRPFTLTEIIERRERGTLARYATLRHLEELGGLVSGVLVPVSEGIYLANVENGVIHRDLKPDNVLVDSRTLRAYVIDFGICHVLERSGALGSGVVVTPTADEAGIVGTPRFLAPEQARGSVHARTDVWGVGALIHFALSGEPPIAPASGITRSELQRRVEALREARDGALVAGDEKKAALCDEKLGRLQADGLRTLDDLFKDARDGRYAALPSNAPAALAEIAKKAMSPDPTSRYVNARQIAVELNAWVKGGRVRAVSEAGGTVAAVDSAKRALRGKMVPALLVLLALVVGYILGGGFAGSLRTDTSRVSAFGDQLRAFTDDLDALGPYHERLTGPEAARLHGVLVRRGQALAKQVGQEGESVARATLLSQVAYQRERYASPRVRLAAPAGYTWTAERPWQEEGSGLALTVGDENRLAPGDWVVIGRTPPESKGGQPVERVRVPLRIPFFLRKGGESSDREAPVKAIEIPTAPSDLPEDFVLVVGDQVHVRQAPFAEPSVAATAVPTFLLGRREVTNAEFAQFLASLPEVESKERMPASGFVRDPSTGRSTVVRGSEDLPVVALRPEDARAYAAWRAKRDGKPIHVASEAEWILAAGAPMGWTLPGNRAGALHEGVFQPRLDTAGQHTEDVGPHGERGLLANAREMVEPVEGGVPSGAMLMKGAGVGDRPSQAAIQLVSVLKAGERQEVTGFRIAMGLK